MKLAAIILIVVIVLVMVTLSVLFLMLNKAFDNIYRKNKND